MNVFHDFDVSSKASDLTRTLHQVTEHNFHSGNFMDYNHLVLFKVINKWKKYNDLKIEISLFTDPLFSLPSPSRARDKK